jgi:hypothetical protein
MVLPRLRPLGLLAVMAALVGLYGLWWFAQLRAFKKEIAALANPHAAVEMKAKTISYSGFPYRLELQAHDVTLTRARADYAITLQAPEMTLIRQPWQHGFYLGALVKPVVHLSARLQPAFADMTASADGAQLSLRSGARGLSRLSVTFENFTSTLPWSPKKLAAGHIEFHGREFVAHDPIPVWKPTAPTPPPLFELYMSGETVMLDRGPFILTARAEITGDPKLPHGPATLADWQAQGGTLEVRGLNLDRGTISDSFMQGTFSLGSGNRVQGAASIDTGCVSWLYALLDTAPPPHVPKCGNVLHHEKLQVTAAGVQIENGEP